MMPIDLTKKAEQVTFILEKKGVSTAPTMRVMAALDISGSMDDEIRDGSLQRAVDQLGGVAVVFDDNNEIDVWTFDTRSYYIGTWTPDDHQKFVKKHNIESRGGTSYAPVINDIVQFGFNQNTRQVPREVVTESKGFLGFGKKKIVETVYDTVTLDRDEKLDPVLVMMITDGECGDGQRAAEAIQQASKHPIFFVLVGINNQGESFKTLQSLDKNNQNVSFIKLNGFHLSDEEVYDKIITDKLITFLKKF